MSTTAAAATLSTEALVKIAATGFTGIFAGSAVYITFVQHPAVVAADDLAVQVPFFREMYARAARMQASLAVLGGASALLTHFLQGRASNVGGVGISTVGGGGGAGAYPAATSSSADVATVGAVSGAWLLSGTLMVAIVPYTIATMIPLNHRLIDSASCFAKGKAWMDKSLAHWAKLHNVRTGVSVAAFTIMLVSLTRTGGSAASSASL